jgi:hypothetical protein
MGEVLRVTAQMVEVPGKLFLIDRMVHNIAPTFWSGERIPKPKFNFLYLCNSIK